jgi:flagellar basal-body rod modification protein FlgD
MNIAPVDGATFFGARPAASKSEMNMETFIRLLTVQLANQNPLEPMNDRDFFAQMAQLGTVQGMDALRDSMNVAQASSLIGRTVTAIRPITDGGSGHNSVVTGIVTRMTVRQGEHFLGIREPNGGIVDVRMASVREISQ